MKALIKERDKAMDLVQTPWRVTKKQKKLVEKWAKKYIKSESAIIRDLIDNHY